MTASRFSLPPVPAILLAMISLQGGAAFAKTLFAQVGPLGAASLRVVLAAAVLLLVFRPRLKLTREQWRLVAPYGLLLGLMNMCIYSSFELLPLGLAVTLEFLGPLLLSLYLSRRPLDYLWVGLAGLGILLITPLTGAGHTLNPLGVAFALLAGACWAAYILIGGKMREIPSRVGVSVGMGVAALITLPFGIVQAGANLLNPRLLLAGLAVAVLSSALPYTLEMVALRSLSARVFGVLMSMEPAVAALCGLLILHEYLNAWQWLGLLAVAAASAGISLTGKELKHPEPEPVN